MQCESLFREYHPPRRPRYCTSFCRSEVAAKCVATSDAEHAVSTGKQGPVSPRTYEMRPEAIDAGVGGSLRYAMRFPRWGHSRTARCQQTRVDPDKYAHILWCGPLIHRPSMPVLTPRVKAAAQDLRFVTRTWTFSNCRAGDSVCRGEVSVRRRGASCIRHVPSTQWARATQDLNLPTEKRKLVASSEAGT